MTPEQFFAEFAHIADAPNGVQKLRELIFGLAAKGSLLTDSEVYVAASIENLGDIADFVMGQAPPGNECNKLGIGTIFVKTGEFGPLFPEICEWTTKPLKMAKTGDVLICVVGATVGKLNLGIDCAIGRSVAAIRPKPALNTKYLYFVLMPFVLKLRAESRGSAQGVIGKQELHKIQIRLPSVAEQHRIVAKVDQLMAFCDELETKQAKKQQKLTRLNNAAIDRLLTSREQAEFSEAWGLIRDNFDLIYTTPDSISKLRQAILQLAVQGKLVPQDPSDEPASALLAKIKAEKERLVKEKKIRKSDPLPPVSVDEAPYELPQGWEWVRFVDIANIASNLVKTEPYLDFPHVAPDNIEKFTGRLLPYRTVREDGVMSGKHLFFKGQILYSKIRPNLSKVTIVDFDGLCSADMYPIDAYISALYLMHYMLSSTFLDMAVKKDTRVAMPKINQEELNRIIVPVCPLAEQHRIVAKVNRLMALCDEIESRIIKSQSKAEKLAAATIQGLLAA